MTFGYGDIESSGSDENDSELASHHHQMMSRLRGPMKLGLVSAVFGVVVLTGIHWQKSATAVRSAGADDSIITSLSSLYGGAIKSQDDRLPPAEGAAMNNYFKEMTGMPGNPRVVSLVRGHECYDNEEKFEGLCYKKCEALTFGRFQLRTSAWTCCHAVSIEDCFVANQEKNIGLCSGFDVSGDGESCPRLPGKCMDNEELFLGECFEKCSILTSGAKPFRTSAFSCCETTFGLSCFYPSHVSLSPSFDKGGGVGDGDVTTPSGPHRPFTKETMFPFAVAN